MGVGGRGWLHHLHLLFCKSVITVFPRFSVQGRLPIFEAFGGALNRAGALTRVEALIKTYENLDLPFFELYL